MTTPVDLTTERLLLRGFRESDIPELVRLAGAREVAATTLLIPHPYLEPDARDFLLRSSESLRQGQSMAFAITVAASGDLCGGMGLRMEPEQLRAELGYWIAVPFWRRGYCTEAAKRVLSYGFQELLLNRIFAQTFAGNTASQRVLEKLGMRHEGILRQHLQKWGVFVDIHCYGVLRQEFCSHHQRGDKEKRG